MGLLDKLFGRHAGKSAVQPGAGDEERRFSLQVLFERPPSLATDTLTQALRSYHRSLRSATFEVEPGLAAEGRPVGQARWDRHVIDFVSFDVPIPPAVMERCVDPAHYAPQFKEQARAHKAHGLLFYSGESRDPLERYVALATAAAALSRFCATTVLNEAAHTSEPATILHGEGDALAYLRALPLLLLYCGFVKYEVEGVRGVWMRTYGAELFDCPNLATLAPGHEEGQAVFVMFTNILAYIRDSDAYIAAGHTIQVGRDTFGRFRAPTQDEYFLADPTPLLVVEQISASKTNR